MPTTLYQKYRPQRFDQIVGQQHIVKFLQAQIVSGNISHAYIFIGPRGTGKTTTARIFATAINCQNPDKKGNPCGKCNICKAAQDKRFLDLVEIDAASNRGIDNIRQLQENINLAPTMGRYKVYVIDEVHMLTKEAFNALLKTLEEPPEHVVFILATTEPHKVLPTVMSRCERYVFHLASAKQLEQLLDFVADKEGITVQDDAKQILVRQARGSFRDLLSILDPIFNAARSADNTVTPELVLQTLGLADTQIVQDFLTAVFSKDMSKIKHALEQATKAAGNIDAFIKTLIDTLEADIVDFLETGKLPDYAQNSSYNDLVKFVTLLADYAAQIRLLHSDKLALYLSVFNFLSENKHASTPGSRTMSQNKHANAAGSHTMSQNKHAGVGDPHPVSKTKRGDKPNAQPASKTKQSGALKASTRPASKNKHINTAAPQQVQKSQQTQASQQTQEPQQTQAPQQTQDSQQKTSIPANQKLTLEKLQENWPQVLSKIKQLNVSLYSIFTTCKPVSVVKNGHGVCNVIVAVRFEYHKQKIASASVQQALRDIFKQVYGVDVAVVPQIFKSINEQTPSPDKTLTTNKTSVSQTSQESQDILREVFGEDLMI